MKKWISIVIAIIVIIILIMIFTDHHDNNSGPATTVTVTQGNIVEQVQAAGYITPQHTTSVKSEIAGTVSKVFAEAGSYVKKGQPLVAIQPKPSPADYAAAKEAVLEKTADLNSATANVDRYQQMLKEGLISKEYGDYITAQQTYGEAKAQLELAKQDLSLVETGRTTVGNKKIDNTIVAPIDGYVMKRNVDVGDFVDPISSRQTATILYTISDMKNLMFQGYVDEADSHKIHTDMPATVEVGAIPNLDIKGVLTKISLQSQQAGDASRAVDESSILTRSPFTAGFQVQVTKLQVPQHVQLRDGYSATANIAVKSALNVPILPERVLHFDGEKAYVLLPSHDAKNPKKQYVQLGISNGMDTEITGGLKVGDKVLDTASSDSDS